MQTNTQSVTDIKVRCKHCLCSHSVLLYDSYFLSLNRLLIVLASFECKMWNKSLKIMKISVMIGEKGDI